MQLYREQLIVSLPISSWMGNAREFIQTTRLVYKVMILTWLMIITLLVTTIALGGNRDFPLHAAALVTSTCLLYVLFAHTTNFQRLGAFLLACALVAIAVRFFEATYASALLDFFLAAVVFGYFHLAGHRYGFRRLLGILTMTLWPIVAFGLANHLFDIVEIPWMTQAKIAASATFPNRNSFATFANLIVLANLAILASYYIRLPISVQQRGISNQIIYVFGQSYVSLYCFMLIVSVAASFQAASRGGFLSLALALIIFCLCYGRSSRFSSGGIVWLLTLLALMMIVVGGLEMSGHHLEDRLNQFVTTDSQETRRAGWQASLEALSDHRLYGTGLGTFSEVFEQYRPMDFPGRFHLAHNSYLELASELGVPLTICILIAFATVFMISIRRLRHPSSLIRGCLGVSSTVLVATHALVDFSMQIPAVAMSYAAVMGIATAPARQHSTLGSVPNQSIE